MTTFNPGNIVIDKNSQFGLVHLVSNLPDWPDLNLWETSIERWLRVIAVNSIVGDTVLHAIEHRPAGNTAVYIVPAPGRDVAKTDGIVQPGGINTTGTPAIFVTFLSDDAYQMPLNLGPMKYPPVVLLHELVHVVMMVHRLRQMAFHWSSWAYPTPGEFLATTIQNMMLSEHGARLADGYTLGRDDPAIISVPLLGRNPSPLGVQADNSRTDTAAFVARYRPPLLFLWNNMRTFTQSLANNPWATFNPFRVLRNELRASGRSVLINPRTRTRQPGPLRRIPRRRPIRIA
jgi:hypothetical protein